MSKRKTQSAVTLTDGNLKTIENLKGHIASYLDAQLNGKQKIEAEQAFGIKDCLRALAPKFRIPQVEFSELELHTVAMFLVAALRQSLDATDKNLFQWACVPETPVSQENS